MANFRFRRRVHLFPGLSVNVSRSGPSLSLGVRGAHVTLGARGVTRTVGIPGSGVYWTSRAGASTGFHSAHVEGPVSPSEQSAAHAAALACVVALAVASIGGCGLLVAIASMGR